MIDCFMMLTVPLAAATAPCASTNRFGAVNELGIFAMTDLGERGCQPVAIFLQRGDVDSPNGAVTWEGTRPLLVELQPWSTT